MFYSKYSDYSPEQIIDENYRKVCDRLLSKVKDEKVLEKMKSILYEGGIGEYGVNSGRASKDNPFLDGKKRIAIAYLMATTPETFELIEKNNIQIFHGTNINALPSILIHGLNSVDGLTEKGVEVTTGENWSRIGGKRNYMSFTDDLDVALDYARIKPSKETKGESFGIVLGMNQEGLEGLSECSVDSDLPEIGIQGNVSIDRIKMIAVPKERVEIVKRLVNNENISVVAMDMEEKEYYYTGADIVKFRDEEENQDINGKNQFTRDDVKGLAKERKQSRIQSVFNKIKQAFKGKTKENYEKGYEDGTR